MGKPTVNGAWIRSVVENFVATSKENTLNMPTGEKAFDTPLVGFANGADSLFGHYLAHIGDFYLTPLNIFEKAFPQETAIAPEDLTVISWVLPSTTRTREEQAAAVKRPVAPVHVHGSNSGRTNRQAGTGGGVRAVPPRASGAYPAGC